MYKKRTLRALLLLAALPIASHAHVKWFVDADEIIANETTHFSLSDPWVLGWIGIIVGITIIAALLERHIQEPSKPVRTFISDHKKTIVWIAQGLVGLGLLGSALNNSIIVPLFVADNSWEQGMVILQAIVGFLLVTNLRPAAAGGLLLILMATVGLEYGWLEVLEHAHLVGFGLYLLYTKTNNTRLREQYQSWGLPLLRVCTGVALMWLALQEKLLHPDLGLAFLSDGHQWNIMSKIGLTWCTDTLFILSAGMTEFLFGWMLLVGLVTRLNTAVLSFFFISTAFVLGIDEVIGHLPVFGIALLLIMCGAGQHLRPFFLNRKLKKEECLC